MPAQKKLELINPKQEPLTIQKLRELTGWELSDEQAEEAERCGACCGKSGSLEGYRSIT